MMLKGRATCQGYGLLPSSAAAGPSLRGRGPGGSRELAVVPAQPAAAGAEAGAR